MKKKIKDLTIIEVSKICCSNHCDNCPLTFNNGWCVADFGGMNIDKNFLHEIEKEVEVLKWRFINEH